MKKFKSITIYFALACISMFTANANAACTRADYTGTWRLYMQDSFCNLIIPSSGNDISTSSNCRIVGTPEFFPISGTFTKMDTTCHLKAQSGDGRIIDAWVSQKKDSVSGIMWTITNPADNQPFSGVKK